MKKILFGFIVGYLILSWCLILTGQAYAFDYWPKPDYGEWQSYSWIQSDQHKVANLRGIYCGKDDAKAACIAAYGGYSSVSDTFTSGMYIGNYRNLFGYYCKYQSHSEPTPDAYQVYIYLLDSFDCNTYMTTLDPTDSDGDGLANCVDPWPNDASDFVYKQIYKTVDDTTGEVTGMGYEFVNDGGERITKYIGEYDSTTESIVLQEGPYNDQNLFASLFGTTAFQTSPTEASGVVDGGVSIDTAKSNETSPTLQTGDDGSTNTTEMEALSDIVANTNAQINNQQNIVDALTDISNKLGAANEMTITNSNTSTTVNESGEEETVDITDIENAVTTPTDTSYSMTFDESGTQTDYQELATVETDDLYDYENSRYTGQDNPITGEGSWFGTLSDSFVGDFIEDTELVCTGELCNLSVPSILGDSSFKFDFCQYEDVLDELGVVLVAITTFCTFLMVIRR